MGQYGKFVASSLVSDIVTNHAVALMVVVGVFIAVTGRRGVKVSMPYD